MPSAALVGADDQTTSIDSADRGEGPLIEMRILELLTTRLCHELAGPVAAINNGIELLDEDLEAGTPPGSGFVRNAVALVSDTARIAPAIGCNSTASPMASAGPARALARPPMNLPARFSRREV